MVISKILDILNDSNFVFLSKYGLSSAYLNSTKFCLKFHDAFNWLEEWKAYLHVTEVIFRQFIDVLNPFLAYQQN